MKMPIAFGFAIVALGALAVNENASLVTLGTQGPDTYADGTAVLDGERYALVWTRSGKEFAGFNLDGSVVDAARSAVLCACPLAKGGRCPKTTFVIDPLVLSALKGSGSFSLYLLDTRLFAADGSAVLGTSVQSAKVVATVAQLAMTGAIGGAADAGVFAPSVAADVPVPRIVAMRIEGDEVVLTVENTAKAINYTAATGSTPAVTDGPTARNPVSGGGTIELRVPKTGSSQFFQVSRN